MKNPIKDVKINSTKKNEIYLETMNRDFLPKSSEETNSKALDFWDDEIKRVNSIDLNITIIENSTYQGYNMTEIWFYSPNFINKNNTLKLKGYILYPKNMIDKNPACLQMTGLGGCVKKSLDSSLFYLIRGFIVFMFDYPNHGESDGDPSLKYHFSFGEGKFNETCHCYLTICSAIQALRVIESLEQVNTSQIFVTGGSYGGLNTIWLASICGDRIAGAMPCIATGGVKELYDYGRWNLVLSLLEAIKDIDRFLMFQNLYFDPIYYLKSQKLPPIMFVLGSQDVIFLYVSINATINSISHDDVFLYINNMGHYIYGAGLSKAKSLFLNYTIFNGIRPFREIKLTRLNNDLNGFSGVDGIQINVTSNKTIINAKISYNIIDMDGYPKKQYFMWRSFPLIEYNKNSWSNMFYMYINTSEIEEEIFMGVNEFIFDYYISLFFNDSSCFSTSILRSKMVLNKSYELKHFEQGQMGRGIYVLFIIVEIFIALIIVDLTKKSKEIREIKLDEIDKIEII